MSTSDDLSSFSPVLVHWTKQGSSGQDTILTLPMWKRLENTDSFNATTLKKALAYGGEAVGDVVRAIKAGEHLPMPVVHKLDNGVYWLASGNEVLLALRALRIAPVINLQIPETDDTMEFTDESLQNLEIHTEAMGLSTGGAGLAASGQVSGGPTSGGVLWSDKDKKKDVKTASPALHEAPLSTNGTQPIGEKKSVHLVGKDIYIQTDNKLETDRVKSMIKNKDKTNQPGLSKPTPITGILTKEALSMKAIQKELVEERKELTKLVEARLNLLESSILTEDKHVKLCEKKLVKEMRRLMEVMLKEEISKMELSEISQLIVAGTSLVSGDVATGSATQVGGHRIPKVATVGKLVNFDLMKKVFSGYVKLRKEYSAKIQQATTSRAQGGELQQINMDPNMYKFEKFLVTNVAKLAKFFTALTKASGLIKSGKTQTEKAASFREMTSIFQSVEGLDARETALAIMSLDKDSQTGLARFANDTFRTTNLQQLSQGMRDSTTDYDPRDEYGHASEGPQANASAPAISISPEEPAVANKPSIFQRAKNWFSSRFASNPTEPPPLTVPPPRAEKRPTVAMTNPPTIPSDVRTTQTSSSPPVLPPNAPTIPPANQRRRIIPVPGMTV